MTQTKPTPATPPLTTRWKPYPAYKDSGIEWLGEIPAHWEVNRLKYVAPLSTSKLAEKPEDLPYVGLEHIESKTGRLLLDTPVENVESTISTFEKGDVLFGKLRPYLAKVLYADFRGVCTTELLVLQPSQRIAGKFLFYRLLSNDFIKLVNSLTYGTKMPRAGGEQIGNLCIQIPSLPEQYAIAAFLDRETTRINTLIAKKERLIELLQEKRAALISQAVTKGLDPTVPMKDSGIEWLGEIPAHWEVKRLKYAAKLESGHTPNRAVAEYWENCTIPWVTLNDVGYLKEHQYIFDTINHVNELGLANSSARLLPANTVILSRDATVGRCGILGRPMATSQHFVDWICHEELLPDYLLLVFAGPMQQEFSRLTMGATIRTIGMPDVNSFRVPLPPISEQERIVQYIGEETAKIDALISRIREAIEKLKEYSTALISAAVTGKIDVRETVTA
jgi:type I restriction enzyme, S subunit